MYYNNFKVKVNNITWIIPKRKRGPVCLFWGLFILIPLCIRLIRDPRLSTSNGRQCVYLDVYRQMMYDPYRFYIIWQANLCSQVYSHLEHASERQSSRSTYLPTIYMHFTSHESCLMDLLIAYMHFASHDPHVFC